VSCSGCDQRAGRRRQILHAGTGAQPLQISYLRHAERMESLGHLVGGIAHDFNNLLNVITGFSDLLVEDLADLPRLPQRGLPGVAGWA